MIYFKIPFIFLLSLVACTLAWGGGGGGGGGQDQGFGGRNQMAGRYQRSQGFQGGQGYQGQNYGGAGGAGGPGGRQFGGQDGSKKYRSNLYSDDDVYGYDATYPNGEAAYINYKSKDARARRGPEFARTSRAYSRQGGGGGQGFGQGQSQGYEGGMW